MASLSSRLAILVGKAGKNILWTFGEENTVTITAFLKRLRKYLPEEATLVLVTDGNPSYVDPVGSILPQSIHVRHFHKNWNQVIVHYPLENRVYSLLWPHRHAPEKKHRPCNSLGGCEDESPKTQESPSTPGGRSKKAP